MPGPLLYLDVVLLGFAVYLVKKILSKKSEPLPPGPSKLPFLENVLDMPSSHEWFTFAKWGEKYGDIMSVSVFGQHMIILNSAQRAFEMLESRSSIYSDRPILQMGGEMVGWKNTLVLIPYGERFRNYRKMFHQVIGTPSAMSAYHSVEEHETRRFLQRILADPDDLAAHIRKTAGAIILRISHGYTVQEKEDPFITLADEATEQFALSTAPGGFLVNLIPPLQYVPSWLPGAGFKKTAEKWANTLATMADEPHEFVKRQMAYGSAESSFTSRFLESRDVSPDEEFDIKWSAASLYSGGADTTVSAIYALFLAVMLYPEAAEKAREEIDKVVGKDRLPSFADRDNLPYTNALALEVFRWHSVTPTGVPHRVTEDNVYSGYLIPEGSLIIPNIWQMTHDPSVYKNPFVFNPERFLGKNPEQDPRVVCFGFGRRICPGRVLADASLFISCAMVLAVFDIHKHRAPDGTFDKPKQEQTTGTISHLKPFKCTIAPRSQWAADLIRSDY